MSPPTRKAKTTDPSGTANPPAIRRIAATGLPKRIKRPLSKNKAGAFAAPACDPTELTRNISGWRQRTRLDLGFEVVERRLDVCRHGEVVERIPGTVIRDVEGQRPTGELPVDHVLDGCVRGDVHLLEGARDDRRVGVLLVSVDADAVHARLSCRLQHAEPASARDLEQDVGLRR